MSPLNQDKITNRFYIIRFEIVILLTCLVCSLAAQNLQGFTRVNYFDEQEKLITRQHANMTILVNAPLHLRGKENTYIVFYAIPNGNSIEWTKGKKLKEGDDWHFDIQHIAAQTRYVRNLDKKNNYVVIYLISAEKSWPLWKRTFPDAKNEIKNIIDSVRGIFQEYNPRIFLNGHSGGGSFIFGWLDAVEKIPSTVERIAFIDSNYGYEDSLHKKKLIQWLQENKKNNLVVLAYNDSVVIYNGKPLVSPTGGTWYRSKLMQKNLAETFSFTSFTDSTFIRHTSLAGRIKIILKQNPNALIYHTVQVEKNGFIYSLLSNTRFDKKKNFIYFGERVYEKFIAAE